MLVLAWLNQTNFKNQVPTQQNRASNNRPISIQCVGRDGKDYCAKMESPPFPIVSNTTDAIFISQNLDVKQLVARTRDLLCNPPP